MRAALAAVLVLGLVAPAWAEENEAAQAARWADLKQAVFGDRAVVDGSGVIVLDAPARAQDASTVPVSVTLPGSGASMSGQIKAIWLMVDGNPSPLVGAFHFGPAADPHSLRTRVRVDQYTLIHAVAETEDGRLFSAARYVKAAGGCSAPSSKDPEVAMSRLGQMRLRLEGEPVLTPGNTVTANLMISHPNNNGMQMDQISHLYIPPRYIQDIKVTYGGEKVMEVESDISMSEDPVITFGLRINGDGPVHVDVEDSSHALFHKDFDLTRGS